MIFSGVQPSSGALHLGNYLGAIRRWVALQGVDRCLFCIVDLHALTSGRSVSGDLHRNSICLLASYLACGVNPEKSTVFIQSSVKEHAELCWLLGCLTPVGWLNRMTQYKDKRGNDAEKATLGLYSYPVLMAADILLYNANLVPVGNDQKQHLELAQDIAKTFNKLYSVDHFNIPSALQFDESARIMSLRDGKKKMSKSDPSDFSRINLIDTDEEIALKVRKATTDSIMGFDYQLLNSRPELQNLVNIYSCLSGLSPCAICEEYEHSTMREFKEKLTDLLISNISPIRHRIAELLEDTPYLNKVLSAGTERATFVAQENMGKIRQIVGLHSM